MESTKNLATVKRITSVEKHPNADSLDLVKVGNYTCITKLGTYQKNDLVVFISPDSVLPDKPWASFYKSKSSRVKAVKLRGFWSFGIVESLSNLELNNIQENDDVTDMLGVIKYEPPIPQNLDAKGNLKFGLSKTDEERWENLDDIPYGEEVIISLKIDGQSASYYVKQLWEDKSWVTGITSRSLELKEDSINNYTRINEKYNILERLKKYCQENHKNYCLRGEIYGQGVQAFENNPHSKLSLDFAAFSLFNFDSLSYEPFYLCWELCKALNIPIVPIIKETVLTPELVKKYSEDLDKLDGKPFEGVVVKRKNGQSFKIINKNYDSKK